MTVCYYHVTYEFQSEPTQYSLPERQETKKLLARSRHHIWSLSDSNAIRTHNHITIECGFTLKLVRDMITCSQMQRTDKNSWHSSIVWPVQLNGWVFVYKVSGCAFKSRCCHLNFSYGTCFEQGVPWHSGKL